MGQRLVAMDLAGAVKLASVSMTQAAGRAPELTVRKALLFTWPRGFLCLALEKDVNSGALLLGQGIAVQARGRITILFNDEALASTVQYLWENRVFIQ